MRSTADSMYFKPVLLFTCVLIGSKLALPLRKSIFVAWRCFFVPLIGVFIAAKWIYKALQLQISRNQNMLHKKISVIIVSYNVQYFLELCLDSVVRASKWNWREIIVVDNNSGDDSCALVRDKFAEVILIANKENAGFSKANNQGLAVAQGEYIHFLNPDTVVPEDLVYPHPGLFRPKSENRLPGPQVNRRKGIYAPDSKKSFPSFWTSVHIKWPAYPGCFQNLLCSTGIMPPR